MVKFILDPLEYPNFAGEYLRGQFFNQRTILRGCYSTFELWNDVETLPNQPIDDDYEELGIQWNVFRKFIGGEWVVMKYYWDGDGVLRFEIPSGLVLENGDCKHDDEWRCWTVHPIK